MRDFFILAHRNVRRNVRRTLLTMLTIVLGLAFIFAIRGFLNGLQREIKENVTKAELGEIQVVKRGFRQSLPAKSFDYLFEYNDEVTKLVASTPHVSGVTGRILVGGLVNHQASQTTTPALAIGVDPDGEAKVCPRLSQLVKTGGGQFLKNELERAVKLSANLVDDIVDAPIKESIDFSKPVTRDLARDLPTEQQESHQILIGEYMRRGFTGTQSTGGAALGDELILMVQDVNGSQRSLRANLSGVLDVTNPTANKTTTYLTLETAQRLAGAPGKVTQLVLSVDNPDRRFEVVKELNSRLAKYDLVAEPWDDINKFFVTVMGIQNAMFSIITAIITVFVVVAIIITALMSVSERTREIGTLMAIGYKRRHIMVIFLLESTLVGVVASMIGVLIGGAVIFALSHIGLPFQVPGTENPVTIRPFATGSTFAITAAIGVLAGVLGALYPARMASKMSPLEAMVHI